MKFHVNVWNTLYSIYTQFFNHFGLETRRIFIAAHVRLANRERKQTMNGAKTFGEIRQNNVIDTKQRAHTSVVRKVGNTMHHLCENVHVVYDICVEFWIISFTRLARFRQFRFFSVLILIIVCIKVLIDPSTLVESTIIIGFNSSIHVSVWHLLYLHFVYHLYITRKCLCTNCHLSDRSVCI